MANLAKQNNPNRYKNQASAIRTTQDAIAPTAPANQSTAITTPADSSANVSGPTDISIQEPNQAAIGLTPDESVTLIEARQVLETTTSNLQSMAVAGSIFSESDLAGIVTGSAAQVANSLAVAKAVTDYAAKQNANTVAAFGQDASDRAKLIEKQNVADLEASCLKLAAANASKAEKTNALLNLDFGVTSPDEFFKMMKEAI